MPTGGQAPNIWQSDGAGREALREELPQTIRVIRFDGDYVNLWGFGNNIYLALSLAPTRPDSTPMLYKMSPGGRLETLLTFGEAKNVTGNPDLAEIVSVLEAPDGTIFCTTHPEPVRILRKRPQDARFTSVYSDPTMLTIYGMAVNPYGDIFATIRGSAAVGGPHRAILRSQDGGDTWVTVWSDNNDWLFGIEAVRNYVVAGGGNIIVNSLDRGDTWSTTNLTGTWRAIKYLQGNLGLGRGIFIALSHADYYAISLDGGASWITPANKAPFRIGGIPNLACVSPSGELYVTHSEGIQFAKTRGLGIWKKGGMMYSGVSSRGIYVTDSHVYLSSMILRDTPYDALENNGMVWIIPLKTLSLTEDYAPLPLWSNESITDTVNGETTDPILTHGVNKKTFYIISDQSGTLYVQAYDEVAGNFKDIDSMPVSADTLTPYMTYYGARIMRLRFVPSAGATVSSWAVLE